MSQSTQQPTPQLTPEQVTQAKEIITNTATEILSTGIVSDDDRTKAARLYGRVITAITADNTVTDDDVVRANAVALIAGGASFGEVIKYMVDCLTGNPVTTAHGLDDDRDLLDDLGGQPAADPDLGSPAPQPPQTPTTPQPTPGPAPKPQRGARRGGGPR